MVGGSEGGKRIGVSGASHGGRMDGRGWGHPSRGKGDERSRRKRMTNTMTGHLSPPLLPCVLSVTLPCGSAPF